MKQSFTEKEIINRFLRIRPQIVGGRPKPHKPLLLIWTISKCLLDEIEQKPYNNRLLPFSFYEEEVSPSIQGFRVSKTKLKVSHPYWRLQNDGFWDIHDLNHENLVSKKKDPCVQYLRNTRAGLAEADYKNIRNNPSLGFEIILQLLFHFIPENQHEEILVATNVLFESLSNLEDEAEGLYQKYFRRIRDHTFRKKVLLEYQHTCAVCRLTIRLENYYLALEAAHIKAVQYNGPNKVSNGLSLCPTHHSLFDNGAFTIAPTSKKLHIEVSKKVSEDGNSKVLFPYKNQLIKVPRNPIHKPGLEYIEWHRENVFVDR